jgi:hypothetical protein
MSAQNGNGSPPDSSARDPRPRRRGHRIAPAFRVNRRSFCARSAPTSSGQWPVWARAGIAIDGSERRLWVDCRPSCIERKSAAVGGKVSFVPLDWSIELLLTGTPNRRRWKSGPISS